MSIRHLVRKLDPDAVARVLAGNRHEPTPIKKVKPPRAAETYRAARRNAVLRGDVKGIWKGIKPTDRLYVPELRLNRSANWRFAKSYAHARTMAPFPELPVR